MATSCSYFTNPIKNLEIPSPPTYEKVEYVAPEDIEPEVPYVCMKNKDAIANYKNIESCKNNNFLLRNTIEGLLDGN